MKKLIDGFFSMITSVILLVIFAAAIGYATFAENSSGTEYAKHLVYNSAWFEILLIISIINLAGSILKYKLINKRKWPVLLFHLAFICILIGAGVTRYFGSEGVMHIRQGETSDEILTEKTAVKIIAEYNGKKVEKNTEVNFSPTGSNQFSEALSIGGKNITVENELFVPNSVESVVPDEQGSPAVSVFVMSGAEQSAYLTLIGDEKGYAGNFSFGFENGKDTAGILFSVVSDSLYFKSAHTVSKTGTLASGMIDRANAISIAANTLTPATQNTVFRAGGLVFMINGFMPRAKKTLVPATTQSDDSVPNEGSDALVLKISDGNSSKEINVLSSGDQYPQPTVTQLNDVKISVFYGKMQIKIPFSITLRKFELERYPGSMSPSSYASEITVTDNENKSVRPFRIYMNNILNYRGYRFFQSSYDQDEMGTILSVNHDYWGTMVTYLGYLLMLIGMVMTLFNKNSRFRTLMNLTSQIQMNRKVNKTLLFVALLSVTSGLFASGNGISKSDHIKSLNSLLVQDGAQGRIEPLCSYASDILRKISKHDTYKDMSGVEVILGMSVNSSYWSNEPIIKVANPQLEEELGAVKGYISYNKLFDFDKGGSYKLKDIVDKIYQKPESERNKYEKEALNVDERVNICTQIYLKNMLALFPVPGVDNGKWTVAQQSTLSGVTAKGTEACPYIASGGKVEDMGGAMTGMNADSIMSEANPHAGMGEMTADSSLGVCTRNSATTMNLTGMTSNDNLLNNYLDAVIQAEKSGNWSDASQKLALLKKYQLDNGGNNLPSPAKINLEISYNKWGIFLNLAISYAVLGLILLLLHFFYIFKPNAGLEKTLSYAVYPLAFLFLVYTFGLAVRWYISGHAPWSNGYESMIFVGWGSSLSGLLFARKSTLAFSATALLSAIALSVAGMSWMNPEITNLVPVLKSYWLVVHVAVITSSYGFLALGAILGLLNLILMVARTKKNAPQLKGNILEISYLIEMTLTVGLFMLTVGTFLGGVWANESWGRYWGWDAKETWALVSVLVYAVILHLRLIPKTNSPLVLSTMALTGFSSIIMTFLGVNYYLAGMHSYGKGIPPTIPSAAYFIIVAIIALVFFAYRAEKKSNS
ncbi:MAG: cytochrome c biogenesis protein CcsA [Paludibacter sp.]